MQTFDEYVEYLPNVVNAGIGPGQKEIYIRGSASEQGSVTVSSAQGSAPGVALYLDEMPDHGRRCVRCIDGRGERHLTVPSMVHQIFKDIVRGLIRGNA